ncbi:MFS transporter [Algoriphagus mannitolivorans]|uniref:MFS transporter n=1 Tax=Algoriphagus mannitolivorans TaxID=226504 RepID=UPI000478A781|nr:MFS transporter [Algoriphagus mannitolivorans]
MMQISGLRANWKQFTLLVVINAFVGGIIGMERTVFPKFAVEVFGIESHLAMLSFIAAFGLSKAMMNYFSGRFAADFGRKNLLLLGWLVVLPVPLILNFTESWIWVIFSNILLGFSQGLTWTSTVVMKIDLVGEKDRGLAMGLNEFSGYLALGLTAILSASLAAKFGIRPIPFWVMEGIGVLGLIFSFFARDTQKFVDQESAQAPSPEKTHVFWDTTWRDRSLSAVTQAGLVNNLNDGMIWGLFPVFLIAKGIGLQGVGEIAGIYPVVWGVGQLFTGKMADHFSHKKLLFWGMLIQGLGIMSLVWFDSAWSFKIILGFLGLGTALVYPTFMTAIAARTHPQQRAESLGVFRLWRDLGYAFGALLSGIIADKLGVETAIMSVGGITLLSSIILKVRMPNRVY